MARNFIKDGFIAIGLYLALAYGTNAGKLIFESSRGVGRVVEAFQGRSNIVTGAGA